MASQAARTIQVVRPHVAMIRFPMRGGKTINPAMATTQVVSSSSNVVSFSSPLPSMGLAETYQKPIGTTPRGSGIEPHLLPPRLQRRPLDEVEIEYINRGGPE